MSVFYSSILYANTYTSVMPFSYDDLISSNAYDKIGKTGQTDWYPIMINESAQIFAGFIKGISDTNDAKVKNVEFVFEINNLRVPIEYLTCYAFSLNWSNELSIKSLNYKNKIMEVKENAR